jgi:hypothetical protein
MIISVILLSGLITRASVAEELSAMRINDFQLMLCRVKSKDRACADYSVKFWPLDLKGAAFLLDHCIPPYLVPVISGICDIWNRYFVQDKEFDLSFYKLYPACRTVWKVAQRYEADPERYADNYEKIGCFSGTWSY